MARMEQIQQRQLNNQFYINLKVPLILEEHEGTPQKRKEKELIAKFFKILTFILHW